MADAEMPKDQGEARCGPLGGLDRILGDVTRVVQHRHVQCARRLGAKPCMPQRSCSRLPQSRNGRIAAGVAPQDQGIAICEAQQVIEDDGQWRADHASRGCDGRIHDGPWDRVNEASYCMQCEPPRNSWRLFGLSQAATAAA